MYPQATKLAQGFSRIRPRRGLPSSCGMPGSPACADVGGSSSTFVTGSGGKGMGAPDSGAYANEDLLPPLTWLLF